MKRLVAVLSLLVVAFTAAAQMETSIIIDTQSFRAVQADALTGVNIDPIGRDLSRNACARVKIRFANMNRAQVEALEVKSRSNTDLTKQRVAEYYDNVLVLEMTAKPNTRFYLFHPEFGESNEVTLGLEGDREYELDARLNQAFSIVVDSNVAGADVYLDSIFKGRTDDNFRCTLADVMIGVHTLKVVYGNISHEQSIEVNKSSISFRQNVNIASSKPQYVVFVVEPSNSIVTIDNQLYVAEDGVVVALLENGTHSFKAEAQGYHPQSGTFTVSGEKVERTITLKGDFATVTLTADSGADIYVNDKRVGTTSWSGKLNSGLYIFEARKSGYRTQSLTQQITSAQPTQSYRLPALMPIYGSADITSTPAMADITIDGKLVGRTPLLLDNLLTGEHTVVISKAGYASKTQKIVVADGKTTTVSATLTKVATQTPSATPSSSGKTYKVGDYYNDGKKEGVVFEVSADGRHGKIVSMEQSTKILQWSSDSYEQKRLIGANSKTDGAYNMAKVKAISDWQSKYPAFKWCADLGEGWYLPSIDELRAFMLNDTVHDAVNRTLTTKGGVNLSNRGDLEWYGSSTESNKQYNGEFCAWFVHMHNGSTNTSGKHGSYYVRAVSAF